MKIDKTTHEATIGNPIIQRKDFTTYPELCNCHCHEKCDGYLLQTNAPCLRLELTNVETLKYAILFSWTQRFPVAIKN